MMIDPSQFLEDQFPKRWWPLIPTVLKKAYAEADALISSESILQVESAQRGRIVAWAVDLGIKKLIDSGQLPLEYRWRSFERPTGKYLELRLSHSVLTISQVADAHKQPRTVRFRENARMNNEPFLPFAEFADDDLKGEPHILMIHGYQSLSFAHLAVPHPLHDRDYRYRTPNLMDLPHIVSIDGPPVEDTDIDFEDMSLLKEEIEKWRKGNDAE